MTDRDNVGTIEDLHASATKITGLTDFGNPSYLEGLTVLLESYERDAQLTPLGRKVARSFLRGALVARSLSEVGFAQHPESAAVRIERPIFVTGLPRTGTTALHRLLTADPSHQGLEMWLTEFPQPRPPRDSWNDNPVFRRLDDAFTRHHIDNPEFMGVHYMSASEVEECWQLLRQSAKSISYECLAYLPTYSAWLAGQSWTDAYARHKQNLQLIGLGDRDRRWVLKNPSHLFALDALMEVYPDALVIQTHRATETAMASACSLAAHATAGWSDHFTGDVIGRSQLDLWSRGLHSFTEARKRYPAEQFIDVEYRDFVQDPQGTVSSIYSHFDLPLTDSASSAMAEMHAESRSGGRKPAHQYTLDDFGLTSADITRAFA
ncbi:sulfotransferase family protein [Antrihabitans stalactiti]|uniref:Sulfotransferase n=1 Tax=Antrihabitans stalactiti TaxID=2584121 RepID=A0A848KRP9_9NOCA|nr:sulfotransferase [Antrihabitans stalactiti]NMN98960.1 sulfotransferase [Antrihabitans stalactiti]